MKKIILLAATLLITITACTDDIDDKLIPSSTTDIADFIYRGLNTWSLYKADVPDLANDRFDSSRERREFLEQFETPEDAFDALISSRDRFSILRSDYIEFENALAGVRTTSGARFSIVSKPNDNTEAFGVVRYVVNNSPAANAGLQRGMLFTLVDGAILQKPDGSTISENDSFSSFFTNESYTISLADFNGTDFDLTGETITLTKAEISINPVHIARTIDVDGKQVGYLHYTGFTNEFDSELNAVFAQFKTEGVSELILDLRYNGGGSVETANDLCTMITGQFEGQDFITQQYNEDRNPENEFTRTFNSTLGSGEDGAPINSLNLSRVFVLTTENSASASELILSGLDPYIDIIQIGTNTRGKFEGSFLLYDSENFRRSGANPGHRYVMLPLTFKSLNADGFTDYFEGFTPDTFIEENLFDLGVQGEESDAYTAITIDLIRGRRSQVTTPEFPMTPVFESDQNELLYQRMVTQE